MKLSRILQHKGSDVATVAPERPILEVVTELRQRRIGAVIVTDENGSMVGILSERDVVHVIADRGPDLSQLTAADLMTAEVQSCTPDHDVNFVMRQMTDGGFRHVPVLRDGKLAGVISIGDVVRARIDELENERAELQRYIAG